MVALAVLALLVTAAALVWIAPAQATSDELVGLRHRLSPLVDRRVLALLATTLVAFTAIYVPYTYISVVAVNATDGNGLRLASVLSVLGVAGIAGNLMAGRLADRLGGRPVVAGALVGLAIVFVLAPYWSTTFPTALLAAAAYGFIGFGVSAPQTYRLLGLGGQASLAVALNGAALYLAIALSGVIGGIAITAWGTGWLGALASTMALVALGLSEIAHRVTSHSALSTGA
ncbi:MFS transporter [Saccharopolyspora sp. NPDC002686]